MKNILHQVALLPAPEGGVSCVPPPANFHALEECSSCHEMFSIHQVMLDEEGNILCAACTKNK